MKVFESYDIAGKKAPNRLVAQAMETNSAGKGGTVSRAVIERCRWLARGNWGMVFVEAVSITGDCLARRHSLILNKKNLTGFKRLVESFRRENGDGLLLFQLTHPGRFSGDFSSKIKAYADDVHDIPVASTPELHAIRDAFLEAVGLAEEAGADGVDIKACHGYLGGELLRPLNQRPDAYGCTPKNRARLIAEVIRASVKSYPDMIVGTRISLYEGIRGGCGTRGPHEIIEDLDDIMEVLGHIASAGAHFFNVSAGIPTLTPRLTRPLENDQVHMFHHFRYASTVKHCCPTVAVIGSAYSAAREYALAWAEENIGKEYVDLAGFGRQSLADPLFPRKLADSPEVIDYCTLCGGCSRLLRDQKRVYCTTYAKGRERRFSLVPDRCK